VLSTLTYINLIDIGLRFA